MAACAAPWPTISCRTITALLSRPNPPDHILIETSGLALPKTAVEKRLSGRTCAGASARVDGVIAVADAEAVADGRFAADLKAIARQRLADQSIDHDTPLGEVFEDQVACADIVILNKADLVESARLAAARKTILAEAPRNIPVLDITEGRIDPRVVLATMTAHQMFLRPRNVMGTFNSLLGVTGAFTMTPCGALFGNQAITVLTYPDTVFNGVSGLS